MTYVHEFAFVYNHLSYGDFMSFVFIIKNKVLIWVHNLVCRRNLETKFLRSTFYSSLQRSTPVYPEISYWSNYLTSLTPAIRVDHLLWSLLLLSSSANLKVWTPESDGVSSNPASHCLAPSFIPTRSNFQLLDMDGKSHCRHVIYFPKITVLKPKSPCPISYIILHWSTQDTPLKEKNLRE